MTLGTILSGGNAGEAAVSALSPELNAKIHEYTKDSKMANLLAHATLSALEAKVSGGNALAGATAGVAGEASAMLLAEAVFNKTADQLTEEERNLLSLAGQLSGALAGNTVGGNTASTIQGMTTAKSAVENNFLSDASRKRLNQLRNKALTQGVDSLSEKEKREFIHLTQSDQISDALLDIVKKGGKLSAPEQQALDSYINRYIKETVTGNTATGTKLARTMSKDNAIKQFEKDYLKGNYQKDYSYPYAGTNLMKEQYVSNLSAERKNVLGWRSEEKSTLEKLYYSVSKDLNVVDVHNNSFHGKLSQSVMDGLTLAGGVGVASASVLSKAPIIGKTLANAAEKYPLASDIAATAVANTGYQLSKNDKYDPYNLLQAELSTVLTRGRPLAQQVSINTGINVLGTTDPNDYGWNAAGAILSTLGSNSVSKINFGSFYGNILLKPVLSQTVSEYLGNKDEIKSNVEKFREKAVIKNQELK